ncbi:Band 4.1-like protein 4A [Orchesella cincta]|uniref:Band 4.1-like protein 4A n=1 Tax=Orchesella cincta TaxID=48709 RepID=A0A1D2NCW3_ORCCI|nr:Band 4.1-like protein 4A [Orchesella cincta]
MTQMIIVSIYLCLFEQSTSAGQELLDNVFKHLNLIETAYFGLRYIDNTGQTNWLDPSKKIVKQLEGTEPFTLYFGVKFYAADPCKLLEEITRYQFYLQIKQDILQGRLPVSFDLAAELGAYAVQSELGDHDPRRHSSGYISEFRFIANQSPELELRVGDIHKSMAGQVPAEAELNYLEKVKWLDMYGVDLHPVLGEDNVDYFLGLTPAGIIVLRNKTKVGNYFWPRISKLTHKGKYFMIRVKNKTNEEQTYGFETPSKAACKHLWRCSVEHHAFFRLVQVAPTTTTNSAKMNSLNARFRDSGRSETSVRRRAQPQFVRTPSRRYTRRVVEGAQDAPEVDESGGTDTGQANVSKVVSVPQSVVSNTTSSMYRTNSMAQMTRCDSPRSIRSAPWPVPNSTGSTKKGTYSVPSPRSVRSAGVGGSSASNRERDWSREHKERKRSASAESNSSVDSRSHRRHRHSRSRKCSDEESEISRSSGRSHHSKRRHKNSSRRGDSGSDSENCHHHRHRHRHKHRHSSSSRYEMVDSEVQWREAQRKQQTATQTATAGVVQHASVIPATPVTHHTTTPGGGAVATAATTSVQALRKSGYMNSGLETESEASFTNKRKHKRGQRSKSPKERIPDELKKHLDFHLVDTEGMSSEQLMEIPYKKVETNTLTKGSKVRYNNSIKSNRSAGTGTLRPGSSQTHVPDAKSELPSSGDSPHHLILLLPTARYQVNIRIILLRKSGHWDQTHFTNGRQHVPSHSFVVPPPPSRVVAGNMNKCGLPGFENYNTSSSYGNHQIHHQNAPTNGYTHPSPSESPDSQKVDSHHENSDSGLGTDHHEYYRGENFSSMSYTMPRSQSKSGLATGSTTSNTVSSSTNHTYSNMPNSTTTAGNTGSLTKYHYGTNPISDDKKSHHQNWGSTTNMMVVSSSHSSGNKSGTLASSSSGATGQLLKGDAPTSSPRTRHEMSTEL